MPRLAEETSLHPATLLDDVERYGQPGHQWWVIYTRSRCEKQLMRRLLSRDVGFYCPMVERRSRMRSGRVRAAYIPVFAGYVFVHTNDEGRADAMTTNCVSRCLPVVDTDPFTQDLRQIRRLVESGAPLTPEARLAPGMAARVRNGPFAGVEGVVVKRHSRSRLIVILNFLQQGVSIEMDDFLLEPLAVQAAPCGARQRTSDARWNPPGKRILS